MSGCAALHSGRVTVVIPTFNRAALVARAVQSVLAQSAADLCDIVVVDDGSTDDTPAVLTGFGSHILIVRRPNCGVSAARNAGIHARPNEFIAFLDSDDTCHPERIERQLTALRADARVVLVTSQVRLGGRRAGHAARSPTVPMNRPVDLAPALFYDNFVATSAVMLRATHLRRTGLFRPDLSCCEDYHLWVRLACCGPGVVLDEPLVTYQSGSPGSLTRDPLHLLRSQLRVRHLLRRELRRRPDCRACWQAGLARCEALIRDQYYRAGHYGHAWRYGVQTILRHPLRTASWEWGRMLGAARRAAGAL